MAVYNTGSGIQTMVLEDKKFNDGLYHVVNFVRDGQGAYLSVDGMKTTFTHTSKFSKLI